MQALYLVKLVWQRVVRYCGLVTQHSGQDSGGSRIWGGKEIQRTHPE